MSLFKKSAKKESSRSQIAIEGVRDGIVELPGKQYRLALELSSINFELKSEAEQDAIIDTYQSFLNSLTTPLQIITRIRELDMDHYIDSFSEKIGQESEEVYKQQITNYTDYVRQLVTANKILTRRFYIVVPLKSDEQDFDVIKELIQLTADIIAKGLGRLGMQTRQLSSLEILDLFYGFYSPDQRKRQPLSERTLKLIGEAFV